MKKILIIILSALFLTACAHPCYLIWDDERGARQEEVDCQYARNLCKRTAPLCDYFYLDGAWYYRTGIK